MSRWPSASISGASPLATFGPQEGTSPPITVPPTRSQFGVPSSLIHPWWAGYRKLRSQIRSDPSCTLLSSVVPRCLIHRSSSLSTVIQGMVIPDSEHIPPL